MEFKEYGPAGGALVIILHGMSMNESIMGDGVPNHMPALGKRLAEMLRCKTVAIRAPIDANALVNGGQPFPWGQGWAWFEGVSTAPTPEALAHGGTIMQGCAELSAFLSSAPERFGTDPQRTAALGFSQGGTMLWATLALRSKAHTTVCRPVSGQRIMRPAVPIKCAVVCRLHSHGLYRYGLHAASCSNRMRSRMQRISPPRPFGRHDCAWHCGEASGRCSCASPGGARRQR